jgi:hypothetical protein
MAAMRHRLARHQGVEAVQINPRTGSIVVEGSTEVIFAALAPLLSVYHTGGARGLTGPHPLAQLGGTGLKLAVGLVSWPELVLQIVIPLLCFLPMPRRGVAGRVAAGLVKAAVRA